MTFYERMAATASGLIQKYGTEIILKRVDSSNIDPLTGVGTDSETVYVIDGIFKKYPERLIDGKMILSGDRMIVTTSLVEPLITDKIEVDAQDWSIKDIQASNPAGTALVYFIRIRK